VRSGATADSGLVGLPRQYINLLDHVTVAVQTTVGRHFTEDACAANGSTDKWDSVADVVIANGGRLYTKSAQKVASPGWPSLSVRNPKRANAVR
jgi:hypothetical protein